MPKKGIRFFKVGADKSETAGFYYHELVYSYLSKHPEGKRVSHIAKTLKINYETVRLIVQELHKMNRIRLILRTSRNGVINKYWTTTQWRLS